MNKIRVYKLLDSMGENAITVSTVPKLIEYVRAELQSMALDPESAMGWNLETFMMDKSEWDAQQENGRIE